MNVPAFMLADHPLPPAPMSWPYSARTYTPFSRNWGMGDSTPGTTTASQIVGGAAGAAGGIVGALTAVTAVGLATGIGAAVVGLLAVGIAISKMFAGCGQSCVQTSDFANQVAAKIQDAFNQYMSAPVHYASMQAAYLQVFDDAWSNLQNLCQPQSNPSAYGSAGQRCITDRQSGGCTWKVAPFGWNQDAEGNWTYTAAGANGSGTVCWNWFNGMRDPVANDPTVQPDPPSAQQEIAQATTAASAPNYTPLILAAALILGVMLI